MAMCTNLKFANLGTHPVTSVMTTDDGRKFQHPQIPVQLGRTHPVTSVMTTDDGRKWQNPQIPCNLAELIQ
jgi:hypothetical protein